MKKRKGKTGLFSASVVGFFQKIRKKYQFFSDFYFFHFLPIL